MLRQRASRTEHRPFDAEPPQLAVDLDRAAVAGAVAARHRRLPGELGVRARAARSAASIGSGPAREHVAGLVGQELGDVGRLEADLGVRDERRRLGVPLAPEAEERGRRRRARAERYGSGAIPIPPPTSSGRSTSRSKPLPSGPSTCSSSPGSSAQSARVPGPIGSIRNASSPARREADAHRPRQHPARRLEHEELSGRARVEPALLDAQQRVRPDGLGAGDPTPLASHARSAPAGSARSPRARSRSRRRRAAAPESVVMQGTRAASAACRISAPSRRAPEPCGVLIDEVAAAGADRVDDGVALLERRRPRGPAVGEHGGGAGRREQPEAELGERLRDRRDRRPCRRRGRRGTPRPRSAAAGRRRAPPSRTPWAGRPRSPSPRRSSASPARAPDRSRGSARTGARPPSRSRAPAAAPRAARARAGARRRRAGRPRRRG